MEISAEDINVFDVDDVDDIGNGEPLYANFVYEDWALLSLRVEFHLLIHGFRKDLNDPDRPSFSEDHLRFYYGRYFGKPFTVKHFGVDQLSGVLALIKDTISIENNLFLKTAFSEEKPFSHFVRYAEEHRRERQRRSDAGDETAAVRFLRQPMPPSRQPPAHISGYTRAGAGGTSASHMMGNQTYAQKRPFSSGTSYTPKQPRTSYAAGPHGPHGISNYRR